jgi:acetyltransferase
LNKPVFTNWLGAQSAEEARRQFEAANIPTYDTPEKAVRGFMHMVRYRRGQQTLMEVPPSTPTEFRPDNAKANVVISDALKSGEGWLDAIAVQDLLTAYEVPVARTAHVANADEAAAKAAEYRAPIALKIYSPDITHKSDVGGVALDLNGTDAVKIAADAMLVRVAKAAPKARLEGFVVQEMIRRPGAYELILGMADDATFGPFMLFGHGGTAVEVIGDKALGLPPLNLKLAQEMIQRTRIWHQLRGIATGYLSRSMPLRSRWCSFRNWSAISTRSRNSTSIRFWRTNAA